MSILRRQIRLTSRDTGMQLGWNRDGTDVDIENDSVFIPAVVIPLELARELQDAVEGLNEEYPAYDDLLAKFATYMPQNGTQPDTETTDDLKTVDETTIKSDGCYLTEAGKARYGLALVDGWQFRVSYEGLWWFEREGGAVMAIDRYGNIRGMDPQNMRYALDAVRQLREAAGRGHTLN